MQTKKGMKRFIASLLAAALLVSTVPVVAFAEVKPANWVDDETTARYWPIPYQGNLIKVSSAEPLKNPSLRFIGAYTRPDGREVVRLAFGGYSGALSGVWEKLLLKPDANLNSLVDWKESGMGEKRPEQAINNHDGYNFNNNFIKFESLSAQQAGSGNIHVMDLSGKGTNTVKTGLVGVHFEVPIDLVLNEGSSVKSLKNNPLIQMRLMDSKYEKIYSTTIEANQEVPYSSYTMSTFIPVREDLTQGTIKADVVRNYENIFQSASSYIKYNEKEGYVDVYTRRTHGTVENQANNGGSFNAADQKNKGDYGFRQTFDKGFIDVLKPQDESGTVAQIFTANATDELNYPSAENPNVPLPANRIDYALQDIQQRGGIGILEVSNNEAGKTFMPTGTTLTSYGDSTVVRYFIDKDKLKEKFGNSDIIAYEFFSTLFSKNNTGVEVYKSPARDEDINLKRGDKINIHFDGRRDLITLGTFDVQGSFLQIGDDQYAIPIRTTADKAAYNGTGTVWDKNYMRSMELTVPFDIKIKQDTPLAIFSRKTKLQQVSPGMTVRFEYTTQDDAGYDVKEEKTYRFERDLKDGYTRNDMGEIFKNGMKINNPADNIFVDNYDPLVTSRQANFGGGILTRTADAPDVDEIFTDSQYLTGRSKYDRVNVYLYDANKKEVSAAKRLGTIEASGRKIEMNVNGDDVQGYEWTSASNKGVEDLDPTIWALKDTPLFFTNQDVLQNALENDEPVVELVQAKVKFDLNGGTSPIDTISYQGVDSSQKVGTEEAYVLQRSTQTEAITRIAPMNEKSNNVAGYKPNGFEGEGVILKNHNGENLQGNALTLRKFPTGKEEPEAAGKTFLGWTTHRLTGSPEEVTKAFNALEVADSVDKVNNVQNNYIFTKTSPITKGLTVYAAYGSPQITFHTNPKADGQAIDGKTDVEKRQSLTEQNITDKLVTLTSQYKDPDFQMPGYSLVGFSTNPDATEPDANVTGTGFEKDNYLRDGDKLPLTADQVAKGFDLYAIWKPNHKVDVTKNWSSEELKTKNAAKIKIGLLARPAVGVQGHEVVTPDAVYRPVPGTIKELSAAENNKLEWTNLPSYDEKGHRMSYIAVELTDSTVPLFEQGNIDYDKYGITIKNSDPAKKIYGGKTQLVNTDGVDAMSAATVRTHYEKDGSAVDVHTKQLNYFDTYGYSIQLTNKKVDVQPPKIDRLRDGDDKVIVTKAGDPDKLIVDLPGGKQVTLVKDQSGNLVKDPATTFTGDVSVDSTGKVTITLPKGQTFKKGEIIKAHQEKQVGDITTPSEEVSREVESKLVSNPVTDFSQGTKDEDGNVPVEFQVPNPPVNPPKAGSTYELGYVNDEGVFVPVSNTYTLDKDISSESSTPVKSTLTIPKDKLTEIEGKNLVIRAKEPDKDASDSNQVSLDLVAPTAKATAADELWRRWVNVQLDSLTEDTGVIVIKYTNLKGEQQIRVDSKEAAERELTMLNRQGAKDITITLEDKFGNETEVTPDYTATKIIEIMVREPRMGKDYVQVRAYQPDTTVTVRIFPASAAEAVRDKTAGYEAQAKATGEGLAAEGSKYTKISLGAYKLTEGDIIEVIGTTPDGGITNPYARILSK